MAGLLDSTLAAVAARGERAVVLVGYLANAGQVAVLEELLERHRGAVSAVVVDPVSGDDGRAYVGADLVAAWPRLLARATWALPNLTEVELFTGRTGEAGVAALRGWWPELKLIVTGWPAGDDVVTRLYDGPGEGVEHRQARVAGRPSGTGDLFAAEWMREVFLRGTPPAAAMASRRSVAQWCSMTRMAAAPAIRMPVKMVGRAAGKTTLRKVVACESPSTRADRSSWGSTDLTPLMVLRRIGKKQA
mgnify:CR=1 FL=1